MELKDTVKGMMSADYKERMSAEYHQLKIRYERLDTLLNHTIGNCIRNGCDYKKSTIDGTPIPILEKQRKHMKKYLSVLELRAEIELVKL